MDKQPYVKQFHNKNQFLILGDDFATFQSYNSTIATIENKGTKYKLTVYGDWDYSQTTLKHFYLFIKEFMPDFWALYLEHAQNKKEKMQKQFNKSHLIKTGDNINIYEVIEG